MSKLTIETYNDKSFVIYGEDTKQHKESIKAMGGKWNNRLKNKNDEIFGGWIFFMEKFNDVKVWIKNGCPEIVNNTNNTNYKSNDSFSDNKLLEEKIDTLTQKIDDLYKIVTLLLKDRTNDEIKQVENDLNKTVKSQKQTEKKSEKPKKAEVVYKVVDTENVDIDSETEDTKPRKRLLQKK